MKYFFAVILFFLFTPALILSQATSGITIKGSVIDEKTNEPLDNANVFLENTTMGARTKKDGSFLIHNIPYGSYTLIVSYIGYEAQTKKISFYKDTVISYKLQLSPYEIKLKEVDIVSNKPKQWEQYLEIFSKEFIGTSFNSHYTKILNPEVIEFRMDEKTNTLHASSDSVVLVQNNALGYKLYVMLTGADYTEKTNTFSYSIHTKFEELSTSNKNVLASRDENRRASYLGSVRHFIKALFYKKSEAEGFSFFSGTFENLKSGFGVYTHEDQFDLNYNNDSTVANFFFDKSLRISFRKSSEESILNFTEYYIEIDKYGNILRPGSLFIYGNWSSRRVSDMLPNDYVYTE